MRLRIRKAGSEERELASIQQEGTKKTEKRCS
jgi:hypothetical protein